MLEIVVKTNIAIQQICPGHGLACGSWPRCVWFTSEDPSPFISLFSFRQVSYLTRDSYEHMCDTETFSISSPTNPAGLCKRALPTFREITKSLSSSTARCVPEMKQQKLWRWGTRYMSPGTVRVTYGSSCLSHYKPKLLGPMIHSCGLLCVQGSQFESLVSDIYSNIKTLSSFNVTKLSVKPV